MIRRERVTIRCSTPGHEDRLAVRYTAATKTRKCAECARQETP